MRLERLGSFHQTRLSFMRSSCGERHAKAGVWSASASTLDAAGVGTAVYALHMPAAACA